MRADNPNRIYLSDPWLEPPDYHDDECDGECFAGYCAERVAQIEAENEEWETTNV